MLAIQFHASLHRPTRSLAMLQVQRYMPRCNMFASRRRRLCLIRKRWCSHLDCSGLLSGDRWFTQWPQVLLSLESAELGTACGDLYLLAISDLVRTGSRAVGQSDNVGRKGLLIDSRGPMCGLCGCSWPGMFAKRNQELSVAFLPLSSRGPLAQCTQCTNVHATLLLSSVHGIAVCGELWEFFSAVLVFFPSSLNLQPQSRRNIGL